MTQRSSVGRATIARLQLAKSAPHVRTIRALADALGVQPKDLVPDRRDCQANTDRL